MGLNESNKIAIRKINNSSDQFTTVEFNDASRDRETNCVPAIKPCYNGKTLNIHEELVVNGLCAISIRHQNGNCKDEEQESEMNDKMKNKDSKSGEENGSLPNGFTDLCYRSSWKGNADVPECLRDKIKRRNSFWNIHRPELSKLTWPENFVSSSVLRDFFHNHLRIHGTFCEPLHEFSNQGSIIDEEFKNYCKLSCLVNREIIPPRILPPDEKVVNIMEKSRSVQLNDEDLDPEIQVHKSRAEFCVTIGEYVRRPVLKRTTSQVIQKCVIQPANRFESLPIQHECLLSKETIMSEERVSAVIGNAGDLGNGSILN